MSQETYNELVNDFAKLKNISTKQAGKIIVTMFQNFNTWVKGN